MGFVLCNRLRGICLRYRVVQAPLFSFAAEAAEVVTELNESERCLTARVDRSRYLVAPLMLAECLLKNRYSGTPPESSAPFP